MTNINTTHNVHKHKHNTRYKKLFSNHHNKIKVTEIKIIKHIIIELTQQTQTQQSMKITKEYKRDIFD